MKHKQTTRHPEIPAPMRSGVAYWERVLNGMVLRRRSGQVVELVFPEEVHGVGPAGAGLLHLVTQAALPGLSAEAPGERRRNVTALPEPQRLPRLRQTFETLHDGAHPLRQALDKLATLETVRLIEGKA